LRKNQISVFHFRFSHMCRWKRLVTLLILSAIKMVNFLFYFLQFRQNIFF
jgi:hypothetical protein